MTNHQTTKPSGEGVATDPSARTRNEGAGLESRSPRDVGPDIFEVFEMVYSDVYDEATGRNAG